MIRCLSRQLEAHYEETENEPLSQFSLSPHGIVSLPGDMHLVQASVYDVLRLGIQIQLLQEWTRQLFVAINNRLPEIISIGHSAHCFAVLV